MLKVENVDYSYPETDKKVLTDINIEFNEGKIYSIVGKSGSGKTTLLSLLAGLDKTEFGKISYNGRDIDKMNLDEYRAKKVGVIFQAYNLITTQTALENIILSMNISEVKTNDKKATALKILGSMGIDEEKANRKVLKLSGGEQQRVGIARALSHKPSIIIADEPTGNLDSATENEIMKILVSLAHKENKCVIVVTHSENVAEFADIVYRIDSGQLQITKK